MRLEDREDGLAAVLRHHGLKARKALVRDASAAPKTLDDLVFYAAEHRDVLTEHPEVVRSGLASEEGRVLPGEPKALSSSSISTTRAVTIARAISHVALVQPRRARDLFAARRRAVAHRVEEPGSMADRDHQAERAVVQRREQAARESFGPVTVERGVVRHLEVEASQRLKLSRRPSRTRLAISSYWEVTRQSVGILRRVRSIEDGAAIELGDAIAGQNRRAVERDHPAGLVLRISSRWALDREIGPSGVDDRVQERVAIDASRAGFELVTVLAGSHDRRRRAFRQSAAQRDGRARLTRRRGQRARAFREAAVAKRSDLSARASGRDEPAARDLDGLVTAIVLVPTGHEVAHRAIDWIPVHGLELGGLEGRVARLVEHRAALAEELVRIEDKAQVALGAAFREIEVGHVHPLALDASAVVVPPTRLDALEVAGAVGVRQRRILVVRVARRYSAGRTPACCPTASHRSRTRNRRSTRSDSARGSVLYSKML